MLNNGYFGPGTGSPAAALDVNGALQAQVAAARATATTALEARLRRLEAATGGQAQR